MNQNTNHNGMITAKDLLLKILDYNCYWGLPENELSEPARIRLEQIEHLLDVFGLTKSHVDTFRTSYIFDGVECQIENRAVYISGMTDFEYVIEGEFILDRPENRNQEIIERAFTTAKMIYPEADDAYLLGTDRGGAYINFLFKDLLEFRQEIYKITNPVWRLDSGSTLGRIYREYLKKQMRQSIIDNLNEIDDTLCLILDPEKRAFSADTINYKEIDFADMDMNWFCNKWDNPHHFLRCPRATPESNTRP